jgi:hypothetical protein
MRKKDKRDTAATYHDLRAALEQGGCPICRVLATAVERYLDGVLWELVLDLQIRAEINRARGYCNRHAWMLVRTGSALGVAILMQGVVKTLLDELDSSPAEQGTGSVLRKLRRGGSASTAKLEAGLAPQTACPACGFEETVEDRLLSSLVSHLNGAEAVGEAYRGSDGLCLAHFCQAVARVPSQDDAAVLVAAQQAVWQRLHFELSQFIRKNDYRFRDEEFGVERDSWLRALESISGPPGPGRVRS